MGVSGAKGVSQHLPGGVRAPLSCVTRGGDIRRPLCALVGVMLGSAPLGFRCPFQPSLRERRRALGAPCPWGLAGKRLCPTCVSAAEPCLPELCAAGPRELSTALKPASEAPWVRDVLFRQDGAGRTRRGAAVGRAVG